MKTVYWSVMMTLEEVRFLDSKREMSDWVTFLKKTFNLYLIQLSTFLRIYFIAVAEIYKNEGNDEYRKKDFNKAIYFYTEGIKMKCKDDELKAKLYCNRAIAYFYMGENRFCFVIS